MIKYDLSSILESKKAYRRKLAQKTFFEKLLIIEKMRERDLSIAKVREDLAIKRKKLSAPP